MMKSVNVLVFPCGSEVGLELHNALKDISFITLVGASSTADHGKHVFKNYVEGLPFIQEAGFLEALNQLLRNKQIHYIYPAMDEVIDFLSMHETELEAELIAPIYDTVHVCRSKARTYERLAGLPFVPITYHSEKEVKDFPVIIKPAEGYGAKGFQVLYTRDTLKIALQNSKCCNVICEYLSGEEYTVDCFTDRHGTLRYVSMRTRSRIRNGISVRSILLPLDSVVDKIAQQIAERIQMRGAWFFQIKKNDIGDYKLLEVATRVAGTMCVQRAVGVNLPLLSIFDRMGYDVDILKQFEYAEVDRALYNTFKLQQTFSEVFCDFDDTLIVHGSVNSSLMCYLYQCIKKGIPVKLITKHDIDIRVDLKRYRIAPELFDEIVQILPEQRKCDFICPKPDALFIDDSFAERRQMQEAYGIAALGVESIEALIDHKQ